VTDCESNKRAREQLAWPEWGQRASALRRAFVMRIWEGGVPRHLRAWAVSPVQIGADVSTRLRERRCVPLPAIRTNAGAKAFRYWAAEELGAVLSERPTHTPERRIPPPHPEAPKVPKS